MVLSGPTPLGSETRTSSNSNGRLYSDSVLGHLFVEDRQYCDGV